MNFKFLSLIGHKATIIIIYITFVFYYLFHVFFDLRQYFIWFKVFTDEITPNFITEKTRSLVVLPLWGCSSFPLYLLFDMAVLKGSTENPLGSKYNLSCHYFVIESSFSLIIGINYFLSCWLSDMKEQSSRWQHQFQGYGNTTSCDENIPHLETTSSKQAKPKI